MLAWFSTIGRVHRDERHQLRDPARERALSISELLDPDTDPAVDRLTASAARLLSAPVALLSLADDSREITKSGFGVKEPWSKLCELSLPDSLCQRVVATDQTCAVADATALTPSTWNLTVIECGIRAYAGAPIHVDGRPIGALCVFSLMARRWTVFELDVLQTLARATETELSLQLAQRELANRDGLLSTLTDSSLDAIVSIDSTSKLIFANAATERIFQRPRDGLIGQMVTTLMPARYHDAHLHGVARLNDGGPAHLLGRMVELVGVRDGEEFPIELSLSQWRNRGETFYTAIVRDITERSAIIRSLRDAEEQLRLTVDRSPIGIALVSPHGRWLRVNDAVCQFVGYSRDELLELDFQSITHPDDLRSDLRMVQKLLAGELSAYQLEKRYIHRDGHTVWCLLAVSLVRDERGEPAFFISQLQDLTERRKLEQELREASLLDDLTGLQNRRGFVLLGEQALRTAHRYGRTSVLLFADLNGLKAVNDRQGHEAGDRLIVAMAETMRATFRRADIVARLGGDEFVLLAEGDEAFAGMAEVKLQHAIDTYNSRTPSSYPLSASIGTVSAKRDDHSDLKELLATADARMYAAKRKYKASKPAAAVDDRD